MINPKLNGLNAFTRVKRKIIKAQHAPISNIPLSMILRPLSVRDWNHIFIGGKNIFGGVGGGIEGSTGDFIPIVSESWDL